MKTHLLLARSDHPVVITPEPDFGPDGLHAYLAAHRREVDALMLQHGGVLFRGFRIGAPPAFHQCAESLGAQPFSYVGGDTPRTRVAGDVFTATEHAPSEAISLHNEMSYLPEWPKRLFFCSLLPASHGGQTPLAKGADILRAMPPAIVERFREKRVTYIRNFHPKAALGKSWQATYETQDRATLEAIVVRQGSTCTWLPDGTLRVTTTCSALATHPVTGEDVWFNQAEQWHPSGLSPDVRAMLEELLGKGRLPHDCTYGDGDPIGEDVLADVRHVLGRTKQIFDWQPDDFLVVDNVLMMHGREAYKGKRTTLAYLSAS
jgi:alpha-ketoglutarate-dependent taurine dioxygenase